MSQDAERIKRLIAFKKKLEARVEELSSDLKDSEATLETINSILLEKGFKHLESSEPSARIAHSEPTEYVGTDEHEPPQAQLSAEPETVAPLKTLAGELLANIYVSTDSLRVVPAQDKDFDVNTPPFMQFLVEKILLKMQERDSELVKTGQLEPDRILCYNIVRDGDTIREIVVNNTDPDRLRELKSSIRWTLEKMHEKTKGPN